MGTTFAGGGKETRSLSEIGQFRKAFWSRYVERHPDEGNHGKVMAVSQRWRTVPNMNLIISVYVGKKEVGIYIRGRAGASGQEVYEILEPHVEYLTETLGVKLGKQDGDHFFGQSRKADTSDRSTWNDLADWLFEMKNEYMNALQALGEQHGA